MLRRGEGEFVVIAPFDKLMVSLSNHAPTLTLPRREREQID